MDEHLTNIEIKDFKCFKDFKAEGFKRVNLIGGKNNVGKTAFMEACCINVYSKNISTLTQCLSAIPYIRDKKNKINKYEKINTREEIEKSKDLVLHSNINNCSFKVIEKDGIIKYSIEIKSKKIFVNVNEFSFATEQVNNINFIDSIGFSYDTIKKNYASLQKLDKETYINSILNKFDNNIETFKVIGQNAECKVNGVYKEINELGDGVSHLISIVSSLYHSSNGYLFIDEIENGFHYSFLDELWEIILKISKDQNVQVFATTHSKECIESYARVSKKLEDEDITFIELGRNKANELDSIVMNSEMFLRFIKMGNEVRGW